jgi:hypothetical protein
MKQIITDEPFEVMISLRFAPSYKREFIQKYGREIQGLGPEKDCAGEVQQHTQKTDPSSRQRGRPTKSHV